jgi:hypothetical protein
MARLRAELNNVTPKNPKDPKTKVKGPLTLEWYWYVSNHLTLREP